MAQRVFYRTFEDNRYIFAAQQLQILDSPRARLDDDCVNGCSALLQQEFGSLEYAVLSTYTVPELLKLSPNWEAVWRTIRKSQFWTKDVWLIPIHSRALEHWALAVVKGSSREIFMFDSLGQPNFLSHWYLVRSHMVFRYRLCTYILFTADSLGRQPPCCNHARARPSTFISRFSGPLRLDWASPPAPGGTNQWV